MSQAGAVTKFNLGSLVATPGALDALRRASQDPLAFVERHRRGDWGDVDASDKALNDEAVAHEGDLDRQGRVLSAYTTSAGEKLWIITEYDRSATTILLPEEY